MKKMQTKIKNKFAIIGLVLMSITASPLLAGSLKKQIKTLNNEFKAHTFTSLNRLIFKSKYHVAANGDTWGADKGQGKVSFMTVKGAVAFHEGDTAKQVWIKRKSDNKIMVRMFCCGNRKRSLKTTAHVDLFIHSDQDFMVEDVNKQMIANAISGFFEVEGFNDSKAEEVLNNLSKDFSSSNQNNSHNQQSYQAKDTVNSLVITATPNTLSNGESTILSMAFNISTEGENSVIVEETRTLSYQGKTLHGYPTSESNQRYAGEYTTKVAQMIPGSATKGIYKYKAEVCVLGDCISKQVDFTVE